MEHSLLLPNVVCNDVLKNNHLDIVPVGTDRHTYVGQLYIHIGTLTLITADYVTKWS